MSGHKPDECDVLLITTNNNNIITLENFPGLEHRKITETINELEQNGWKPDLFLYQDINGELGYQCENCGEFAPQLYEHFCKGEII